MTSQLIADPLAVSGTTVSVVTEEEAVERITATTTSGDLVLTVGAGDVTALGPRILDALGR